MTHLGTKLRRVSYRVRQQGWNYAVRMITRVAVDRVWDWAWDLWHGTETRREVALRDLGIEGACYGHHPERYVYSGWNGDYNCANRRFPEQLRRLNLDWGSFVYLDLGSGKGKSLLMAAGLPFREVVGVEFSQKLVNVAQDNLKKRRNFNLKCQDIEVVLQDAATYEFPLYPLVIYSFNTFPPAVMRRVLENLRGSLVRYPREVYLISTPTPPEVELLFLQSGFLSLVDSGPSHQTYRAEPVDAATVSQNDFCTTNA